MASYLDAFLEDYPSVAYGALRPRSPSSAFTNYWRGRQGDVWGGYLGSLGTTILGGQEPAEEQTWQNYLRGYDWRKHYLGQSPRARGQMGQSMYAPAMRWLT